MKTKRIEFVESPNRNLVFWFFSIFTALGLFLAKMKTEIMFREFST